MNNLHNFIYAVVRIGGSNEVVLALFQWHGQADTYSKSLGNTKVCNLTHPSHKKLAEKIGFPLKERGDF